ncbi:hypothetical protein G6F70_004104 [Rhizopus microsporus]|nr:hypothetical protein G6F71_000167 [Rhizopus microsporus]KAG1200386.1 hypothetical protein G6F70_004104 [Rhizopus microsporus]KAG1216203.1 hypothetical protein G6F69_000257 [Rhizopus microsporus]KAG1233960.1 hypothetical protein G6F67_003887 [Rhizopus microsporus]KAG1266225.1 hypothetical protein G6F68_002928 [Rhizopus microsporus]
MSSSVVFESVPVFSSAIIAELEKKLKGDQVFHQSLSDSAKSGVTRLIQFWNSRCSLINIAEQTADEPQCSSVGDSVKAVTSLDGKECKGARSSDEVLEELVSDAESDEWSLPCTPLLYCLHFQEKESIRFFQGKNVDDSFPASHSIASRLPDAVEVLGTDDRGIDDQDKEVDCNNEQKAADVALVVPADISVAKICEDHNYFPVKAFRNRFEAFFKNVKKVLKKQPKKKDKKGIAWGEKPDALPVAPIQQACKNDEHGLSTKTFLYEECLGLAGSRIFVTDRQQISGIGIDKQIWGNNVEQAANDQKGSDGKSLSSVSTTGSIAIRAQDSEEILDIPEVKVNDAGLYMAISKTSSGKKYELAWQDAFNKEKNNPEDFQATVDSISWALYDIIKKTHAREDFNCDPLFVWPKASCGTTWDRHCDTQWTDVFEEVDKLFARPNLTCEDIVITYIYIKRFIKASGQALFDGNWKTILRLAALITDKVWSDKCAYNIEHFQVTKELPLTTVQ